MRFTAHVIKGSGRGRDLGTPTLNLDSTQVPNILKHGIYACQVTCNVTRATFHDQPAVLHYGPRPVFKDTPSCEVHLLDTELEEAPDSVTVEIIQKLRDVQDFPSVEALKEQIQKDIAEAHAILKDMSW